MSGREGAARRPRRSAQAVALLGILLGAATRGPAAPLAPEAAIQRTVDEAFTVLKDKALAGKARRAERIARLRAIADRVFDWSEMARSSLGVRWRSLDPDRRAAFVDVFKSVLATQYMDDIDRFRGTEVVTIDGSTPEGETVVVHSTLVTASHERVPIDYRMAAMGDTWRVVDLSIEGVSFVNHFRKTFGNALANMSIDALIDRLRRQLPAASP